MGYGSDLDLLFIYDTQILGAPDAKQAIRMAQQLIQMLTVRFEEGLLYPIDTRLRPSRRPRALGIGSQRPCAVPSNTRHVVGAPSTAQGSARGR